MSGVSSDNNDDDDDACVGHVKGLSEPRFCQLISIVEEMFCGVTSNSRVHNREDMAPSIQAYTTSEHRIISYGWSGVGISDSWPLFVMCVRVRGNGEMREIESDDTM